MSNAILGTSFSLHRAQELGVSKQESLTAALQELGFRRFRLMSYWNIHEAEQGRYDFSELDWQFELIGSYGGSISLCIGKRQPRWPECHLPDWARTLPKDDWRAALCSYLEASVSRYKNHPALESYQLENEALLKRFGYCVDQDFDRTRLTKELELVKRLDPDHRVIMTLSDSYGLPIRKPRADQYAMSLYRHTTQRGKNVQSHRPPQFYQLRASLINLFCGSRPFIHELQAEPWLDQEITRIPIHQQLEFMNPQILKSNVRYALKTGMSPIDLWGLEWWFWLRIKGHPQMWDAVQELLAAR